jgi:hypothetical protein
MKVKSIVETFARQIEEVLGRYRHFVEKHLDLEAAE